MTSSSSSNLPYSTIFSIPRAVNVLVIEPKTNKVKARRIGNSIFVFLRDKLQLPINKEKSGIRRPSTFELLGHGFVPIYKKGIKGQYQFVVKKSSWESLKRKLKGITKKTQPLI